MNIIIQIWPVHLHFFADYTSDYANYYQGIWDCEADEPDELDFQRGDLIHIISKVSITHIKNYPEVFSFSEFDGNNCLCLTKGDSWLHLRLFDTIKGGFIVI